MSWCCVWLSPVLQFCLCQFCSPVGGIQSSLSGGRKGGNWGSSTMGNRLSGARSVEGEIIVEVEPGEPEDDEEEEVGSQVVELIPRDWRFLCNCLSLSYSKFPPSNVAMSDTDGGRENDRASLRRTTSTSCCPRRRSGSSRPPQGTAR